MRTPRPPFRLLRCATPGARAVEARTRRTFPRHAHDEFGVGVVDRGAQVSHSGRGQVEAVAGDVITCNPGEVHDGAPVGHAARSWRILYFDPPLIAEAMRDISEGRTSHYEFTSPVLRAKGLAARVSRLFRAIAAEPDLPLQREALLVEVLAAALAGRAPPDRSRSAARTIRHALSLIDDDPAAPIALADLASVSGLSRFQVLRGFVRATGLTPHAYLVQRRTDLARRLITGGTPLAEAATASGFADQSHMTRAFVRKYGLTPGAWARAAG